MRFIDETLFEENKSNSDIGTLDPYYSGLSNMGNGAEEIDHNARKYYEAHVSLLNTS